MFRRDFKLFISSLRSLGILIGILAAGCLGIAVLASHGNLFSEENSAYRFQLVVCNEDLENPYGQALLSVASNHELASSMLEVTLTNNENEALEIVKNGAPAAVILPEGFFSGVAHGRSIPFRLVVNSAGAGSAKAIRDYAEIGSDVLTSGQLLVFTGDDYLASQGISGAEADSFNLYLNLYAFQEFESAKDRYLVRTEVPYTAAGLGKMQHYAALYLVFFLSFLVLGFYRLYQTDRTREMLMRLRASGISERTWFRPKWVLPAVLFVLLGIALLIVLESLFPNLTILTAVVNPGRVGIGVMGAVLSVFFIAILGAAVSIATGAHSGTLWFALHLIGLFFCGGIVPYARLAPWVLQIGAWTPLGIALQLMTPLFGGTLSAIRIVLVLIAAALYLGTSLFWMHRQLQQVLSGDHGKPVFLISPSHTASSHSYLLFFRNIMRRPSTWAFGLILTLVCGFSFSYASVHQELPCAIFSEDGSVEASAVLANLPEERFLFCNSREEVQSLVQSGKADCGVVLSSSFSERLAAHLPDGCAELLVSSRTSMENFYSMLVSAAIFNAYAPDLTVKAFAEYGYTITKDEVMQSFARLQGDIIPLTYTLTTVDGEAVSDAPGIDLPIGLIAIFSFVACGLYAIAFVRKKSAAVRVRFTRSGYILHVILPRLLPAMALLLMGSILGLMLGGSFLPIPYGQILPALVLYFVCMTVLLVILIQLPVSDHTLITLIALDAILSLVLCPLFWDITIFSRLFRVLRWFSFPYLLYLLV